MSRTSGGSSLPVYGQLYAFPVGGSDFGGGDSIPLPKSTSYQSFGNIVHNLTVPAQTVPAGAGNGFKFRAVVAGAAGLAGFAWLDNIYVLVANEAGTVKLLLNQSSAVAIPLNQNYNFDLRTFTTVETLGTDLTVNATNGLTVDSTAGGQFTAQFYGYWTTSNLQ